MWMVGRFNLIAQFLLEGPLMAKDARLIFEPFLDETALPSVGFDY
jgi:hypothetical protein